MLAFQRITAGLDEIKSNVHRIISLTKRDWAYLLTHPSQLLEPPDTLPTAPPPIEIALLHIAAIHMKRRDYSDNRSLQQAIKIAQPCVDEHLAITNEKRTYIHNTSTILQHTNDSCIINRKIYSTSSHKKTDSK